MNLRDLHHAGRTPTLPLTLQVGGQTLRLHNLLRVLPGQRYVGVAEWQGQRVLAKLLVGGKAERHFARESKGAHLLADQGLLTPALVAEGYAAGEGGWLLFDYLDGAQSLGDAWRAVEHEAPASPAQQHVLAQALAAIAQLHSKGLWQADLHLDNLLQHNAQLYLIDGGGVQAQVPGQPLGRDEVLRNLGVFFAQLPTALEPFLEELLIHYLLANGEHALPLEKLLAEVAAVRRWRVRDYLKKAARDCSLFSARIGAFGACVVRRDAEPNVRALLADPDAALDGGHLYKTGGAATVGLVQVAGEPLVIKRYNVKNLVHWLKRFWRPSRAWHSWREGNRLQVLGIATPQPLAVIERRWCWLRGRAYLLTDYCGSEDLIARFAPYLHSAPPESDLLALDQLFAALIRERISHGDFKGHNLFWHQERWTLIDLDAMQQHPRQASFAKAYARDRARFLRNWPVDSALYQLLNQRLPTL